MRKRICIGLIICICTWASIFLQSSPHWKRLNFPSVNTEQCPAWHIALQFPKPLSSDPDSPWWIDSPWHPSSFDFTHFPSLQFGLPWNVSSEIEWGLLMWYFSRLEYVLSVHKCHKRKTEVRSTGDMSALYRKLLPYSCCIPTKRSVCTTLMKGTLIF